MFWKVDRAVGSDTGRKSSARVAMAPSILLPSQVHHGGAQQAEPLTMTFATFGETAGVGAGCLGASERARVLRVLARRWQGQCTLSQPANTESPARASAAAAAGWRPPLAACLVRLLPTAGRTAGSRKKKEAASAGLRRCPRRPAPPAPGRRRGPAAGTAAADRASSRHHSRDILPPPLPLIATPTHARYIIYRTNETAHALPMPYLSSVPRATERPGTRRAVFYYFGFQQAVGAC